MLIRFAYFVEVSARARARLSVCLSACLPVCISVFLSVCLSVCVSLCLCVCVCVRARSRYARMCVRVLMYVCSLGVIVLFSFTEPRRDSLGSQ